MRRQICVGLNCACNNCLLKLRKKLRVVKCSIWSIPLFGAETWALRALDQTHGKFLNVVLEKDGEDQLDRTCEK